MLKDILCVISKRRSFVQFLVLLVADDNIYICIYIFLFLFPHGCMLLCCEEFGFSGLTQPFRVYCPDWNMLAMQTAKYHINIYHWCMKTWKARSGEFCLSCPSWKYREIKPKCKLKLEGFFPLFCYFVHFLGGFSVMPTITSWCVQTQGCQEPGAHGGHNICSF